MNSIRKTIPLIIITLSVLTLSIVTQSSAAQLSNDFEDLSWGYRKNQSAVMFNKIVVKEADTATFKVLPYSYAKDKNHIYHNGQIVFRHIDTASFAFVEWVPKHFLRFFKDKNYIYDRDGSIVKGADPETFVVLSYRYAKDKTYVFYNYTGKTVLMKGADPHSFTVVSSNDDIYLARDKNRVYHREKEISGADPNSFEYLGGSLYTGDLYGKDKNHVYKGTEVLKNISPIGYRLLSHHYAKNNQYVFHYDLVVPGADPATFAVMGDNYTKDAKYVYYKRNVLRGAEPMTFQVSIYRWWYARDKNHIYKNGRIVKEAEPGTF